MGDRISIPCRGNDRIFSLHHGVRSGSEAYPAASPKGTGALSPGLKRLGGLGGGVVAYYSPPSNAEFRNAWAYTSNPAIRLNSAVLS
jgi:hypothetical protein